jgi:hypothetical protein
LRLYEAQIPLIGGSQSRRYNIQLNNTVSV